MVCSVRANTQKKKIKNNFLYTKNHLIQRTKKDRKVFSLIGNLLYGDVSKYNRFSNFLH